MRVTSAVIPEEGFSQLLVLTQGGFIPCVTNLWGETVLILQPHFEYCLKIILLLSHLLHRCLVSFSGKILWRTKKLLRTGLEFSQWNLFSHWQMITKFIFHLDILRVGLLMNTNHFFCLVLDFFFTVTFPAKFLRVQGHGKLEFWWETWSNFRN